MGPQGPHLTVIYTNLKLQHWGPGPQLLVLNVSKTTSTLGLGAQCSSL